VADRSVGIRVTGAKELRRNLKKAADVDMQRELNQVYRDVESREVRHVQAVAPVDSGDLRDSIRGTRAASKASVVIGRGKVNDYAGVVIFPNNRGIEPNRFPYDVLKDDWPWIARTFEDGVDRVTDKL